jgi:LL-diaminopimelate aminotransferase
VQPEQSHRRGCDKSATEGVRRLRHPENAVIIFDAAYSSYITDDQYPHSIYQVEGPSGAPLRFPVSASSPVSPESVGMDGGSQTAGLSGCRSRSAQRSVEPQAVHLLQWSQQHLPIRWRSFLSGEGYKQCMQLVDYYLENARIIRQGLESVGWSVMVVSTARTSGPEHRRA